MADDSESSVHTRGGQHRSAPRPRGVPPRGEWLFEKDGHVFGPVAGGDLPELLSKGILAPITQIRRDGEAWRSVESVPELRAMLEEWQARVRIEREVRAARGRARRGVVARWTAIVAVAGTVIALVVGVAGVLAVRRPWEKRNALLDGFEVSVTVGTARVARGESQPLDGEIAVPAESARHETPRHRDPAEVPSRRSAPPAHREARAAPPVAPGGLVATAEYDPARIEQVVARSKGTLAPCVSDEARRSPELAGEIPIEFAIGNDGKVVALWIQDARLRSGALHDCLLETLRRWSFQPFAGQRPIVALSFHLSAR